MLSAGLHPGDASRVELGNVKRLIVFSLVHPGSLPASEKPKKAEPGILAASLMLCLPGWAQGAGAGDQAQVLPNCIQLKSRNHSRACLCKDTAQLRQ